MAERKIMRSTRRGFSLIELMFGVSILLVTLIAVLSLAIDSLRNIESIARDKTASNDAQYALEQIKTQSFSSIPAYISAFSPAKFNNLLKWMWLQDIPWVYPGILPEAVF